MTETMLASPEGDTASFTNWRRIARWTAGIIGALIFATIAAGRARATGADPIDLTHELLGQAIAILRNHSLTIAVKRAELKRMAAANFDFSQMARVTLDNHWDPLSPVQREAFTEVFTEFIEDSYLNQIQSYTGQSIAVMRQDLHGDHADVFSTITSPGEDPIDLELRYRRETDGWKIYDVTVDEVSVTSNYRAQFDRVIRARGFDTLMADLRAKQQRLEASLASNSGD